MDSVFQNFEGQLSMGKSVFSPSSMPVLEVVAIAVLEAINLAALSRLQVFQFGTDSNTLVDTIHYTSTHLDECGDIISQCRGLLITNTNFRMSFIRR